MTAARPVREAYYACWWVPAGHRPRTAEAEERVHRLRQEGPTPASFTLSRPPYASGTTGCPDADRTPDLWAA